MRTLKTVLCLTALALMAGCAPAGKVIYDYDKSMDFSPLKSYAYAAPRAATDNATGKINNPIKPETKKLIEAEIDKLLGQRGYTKTSSGSADIWVHYSGGWTETARHEPRGQFGMFQEVKITEAALVIDVVSPKDGKTVWRGVAQGVLRETDVEKVVENAVGAVLKEYPPD